MLDYIRRITPENNPLVVPLEAIQKYQAVSFDSIAEFNEEYDIRKLRPDLAPSFGIPKLTPSTGIISAEENLLIDSNLEKAILKQKNEYRESLNDGQRQIIAEVRQKQLQQKILHQERDQLLKELEERAKTAEILKWVQAGVAIGSLVLGVAAFAAAAIFAGGMSLIGALGSVAEGASGVMQGAQGLTGLRTKELEGLAQESKLQGEVVQSQINALLTSVGMTVNKLHNHIDLCIKDARNRFGIKWF